MIIPPPFQGFPKMARLSREIVVTEKIDGTNAQVYVNDEGTDLIAGSRTRWIVPGDDNYGFAAWVEEHRQDLLTLGPGHHFGEWWGKDVQRNYSMPDRSFSLFNTARWGINRPECCNVVPVLYQGEFHTEKIKAVLRMLQEGGSRASRGFMNPEGIVIFHTAANFAFKKTIDKDEMSKTQAERMAA